MSVEQSHENILEYIQFLFKKIFEFNKNEIISRNFERCHFLERGPF